MSDLISRQAAIYFIDAGHLVNPNEPRWSDNEVVNFLKSRPSAQPERIRGRWIEKPHVHGVAYCSLCDYELHTNDTNFCPNCGAKMDEKMDD